MTNRRWMRWVLKPEEHNIAPASYLHHRARRNYKRMQERKQNDKGLRQRVNWA